jgi:hypothetical protein
VRKFCTYGLIALCLGSTAIVGKSNRGVAASTNTETRFTVDGAFRDGLYLGKLAVESGQAIRPAVGRWSTDQDRSMFVAGYRRGYEESLPRSRRSLKG